MPIPGIASEVTPHSGSLEEAQQAFSSLLTPPRARQRTEEPPPEQRPSPGAEQVPPALEDAADAPPVSEEASAVADETIDPDAQEPQPEDEQPQVRTIRVKLPDGDQELPEPEVAAGYIRQADYTRKTMELAAARKQFEQEELPAVRAERQRYVTLLTQLEQAVSAEPDWDALRATMEPQQFTATWIAHQQEKERLATVQQERYRVLQLEMAEEQKQAEARLQAERQKLQVALPEFADPVKGAKLGQTLTDYALSHGFTPAEAQVTDHRLVVLLHKAYQYDQVTARKPAPQNQVTRQIRAAAPGTSGERRAPTKRAQAEARLRQSGSIDDAAAAFEAMLD